jgi:1,4-alpha-glucan branching enzyme
MGLKKKYAKGSAVCSVTFSLPADAAEGAGKVQLVGEFNGWDPLATPMKRAKNGAFSVTLDMANARDYRFRYLLDGVKWANDPQADRYEWCDYAQCDNSVVTV